MNYKGVALVAVVVALAAWAAAAMRPDRPEQTASGAQAETALGTVVGMAASARTVTVETASNDDMIIAFVDGTKVYWPSGEPATLTDLAPGSVVEARGERTGPDSLIPDEVRILMTASGEGRANDCPAEADGGENGETCRMRLGARITLDLPSDKYDLANLTIDPPGRMGEVPGVLSDEGGGSRTFESVSAGLAVIAVPGIGREDFRMTALVYASAQE